MNVSDALRQAMVVRKVTQAKLAERLDVSQPAIASVLSIGNPQARILMRILGALDYRLVALPAEVDVPSGGIELEPSKH